MAWELQQQQTLFCFLHTPDGGSWDLQLACPGDCLLNSDKIVAALLLESILNFFINGAKNPKRGPQFPHQQNVLVVFNSLD